MTEEQLARINSPCGLDIGARTPAETAIAVLGEILALRAGRRGGPAGGGQRADPLARGGGRRHLACPFGQATSRRFSALAAMDPAARRCGSVYPCRELPSSPSRRTPRSSRARCSSSASSPSRSPPPATPPPPPRSPWRRRRGRAGRAHRRRPGPDPPRRPRRSRGRSRCCGRWPVRRCPRPGSPSSGPPSPSGSAARERGARERSGRGRAGRGRSRRARPRLDPGTGRGPRRPGADGGGAAAAARGAAHRPGAEPPARPGGRGARLLSRARPARLHRRLAGALPAVSGPPSAAARRGSAASPTRWPAGRRPCASARATARPPCATRCWPRTRRRAAA